MIKNEFLVKKIQRELDKANLPVKVRVDQGKAIEGADIGLKVYVEGKRNWELHKRINSIIRGLLRKKDLVAYIDWRYGTSFNKVKGANSKSEYKANLSIVEPVIISKVSNYSEADDKNISKI